MCEKRGTNHKQVNQRSMPALQDANMISFLVQIVQRNKKMLEEEEEEAEEEVRNYNKPKM